MTSAFAAFDELLSTAVDAYAGENVRFIPQAKLDNWGKPAALDTRSIVEVLATFIEGDADTGFLDGDRSSSPMSARIVGQHAWCSVDRARFVPGNRPRKGDFIETIDQPTPRRFEILDVLNDGTARLAFPLVRK